VEVRDLNHHFLRARSAPTLPAWNCGLLRTVAAGEERLVSGLAWVNQRSGSFTVCQASSRPSQPLIAARLLPDAGNGNRACDARRRPGGPPVGLAPAGRRPRGPGWDCLAWLPSIWSGPSLS
jgi:hypothetical protein